MSNASACSTGTQLYVFCSSEIKHCCTNSTNEACYDNPYYDCPRVPPYYNQFSEDWNASSLKIECQVYTPFLVCDKLWASYNDCCNSDSHKCVCPQGEAPSQSVSFYLSTESKPQSAATTSPHVIESSGLSSTTTSTAGPFGAQIPPARPSVLSSARLATPLATPTGRQDLQNSRAAPKANTAAVAGGIAGGIIGLALLLAVLAICYRRRPTRPLKNTDQGKLPRWGAGQARAIGAGGGELEEIKQGPSPSK